MVGFVRSWVGRAGAVIAGLVYTYAPYHLLNLYVRANLVESMAFCGCPSAFGRRVPLLYARAAPRSCPLWAWR